MLTRRRLGPYFFVRGRPFREDRIRAHIVGQHRLGRSLSDILADPRIGRLGSPTLIWSVVCQPQTIAALEANVTGEIEACYAALRGRADASEAEAERVASLPQRGDPQVSGLRVEVDRHRDEPAH